MHSHPPQRHRLRLYLTLAYALIIAYASLAPFTGWREQNLFFIEMLFAPLAQTFTWFDFLLNCLSYLPLGLLLATILLGNRSSSPVLFLTFLGCLSLSALMEYAQLYLPGRVSSNADLLSNSAGALAGALLALLLARYRGLEKLKTWHGKWFKHGKTHDLGLALLALWLFAQVNPSLPMLGSVLIREVARWPFDIVPAAPFNWQATVVIALNLLLLGILLLHLLRERSATLSMLLLVLCMITLLKLLAAAALLKSWAILLWVNSEVMLGIIVGLLLAWMTIRLPHRWLQIGGTAAATAYLVLMVEMLLESTPSSAMRLYHWHYLHLLNYNGLSQLINFLFPILLVIYLWRITLPHHTDRKG